MGLLFFKHLKVLLHSFSIWNANEIRFNSRFFPKGMEVLKPEYVAEKIVDAIETKQVILHLPRAGYISPILSKYVKVLVIKYI